MGGECNEPMRECKELDSGETQGLEQSIHHFVDRGNALSGGVTWSDVSCRRIPVVAVCGLLSFFF